MVKRLFHCKHSRHGDGRCRAEGKRGKRRKDSISLGKIKGPTMGCKGNEKQLVQSDQRTVQRPGAGNGVRGKDYMVSATAVELLFNT